MAVRVHPIKKNSLILNQRGVAVVEMLPLLAVFIILFGLTFGFWTAIHRGTLQSIAARNYAFEVINHRTNFVYHRDSSSRGLDGIRSYYRKNGYRFFAVVDKQSGSIRLEPKERGINLFNADFGSIPESRTGEKVNPIWLKVGYGICLNFDCGGR